MALAKAGTVPPHNLQIEESLLGAALLSVDAVNASRHLVVPDDFYSPGHGLIWAAILDAVGDGEKPDPVTIADRLRRSKQLDLIGGPHVLVELQANCPATSNAARWAGLVADNARRRELWALAGEVVEIEQAAPDANAAADQILARLEAITAKARADAHVIPFNFDAIDRHLDVIDARIEGTDVPLSTGYVDLDEQLDGGLRNGELMVIGGRPGHGKSTVAMNLALNAAQAGRRVLVVSVEMSMTQILDRVFSMASRVPMKRIRRGKTLTTEDMNRIGSKTADLVTKTEAEGGHLVFVENPQITIAGIADIVRRERIDFFVIDYLQILNAPAVKGQTHERVIGEQSTAIKRLVLERNAVGVLLSQLNREVERRADKRPMTADLRDSGSLEQDADIIIAPYRDEVYDPTSADRGLIELGVIKNRQGELGKVRLAFLGHTSTIASMAKVPTPRGA